MVEKGKQIRAGVFPPPLFGQCPKENILFYRSCSLILYTKYVIQQIYCTRVFHQAHIGILIKLNIQLSCIRSKQISDLFILSLSSVSQVMADSLNVDQLRAAMIQNLAQKTSLDTQHLNFIALFLILVLLLCQHILVRSTYDLYVFAGKIFFYYYSIIL